MEIKKLEIKKGATIRDTFLVIILFVGAFGLIGLFANQTLSDSDVTINNSFNNSYSKLQENQQDTRNLLDEMRNSTAGLKEASIGDYAYFGIRGVVTLMQLPISLLSIGKDSISIVETELPIVPEEIKYIAGAFVLILILFAIIKFVTNRGVEA